MLLRYKSASIMALLLAAVTLFPLPGASLAEERSSAQEIELAWPTEEERAVIAQHPELELLGMERGSFVRFLSHQALTQALIDAGLRPRVLVEDYAAHYIGDRFARAEGIGDFFSYAEATAYLDSMHDKYPSITTEKDSIGTSWEGRTIWAIKISDNPDVDEAEPEVLLDALHHAREPIGVSVVFGYFQYLCENYGADPEATFLVDERETWIVPVINPDGYVYNEYGGTSPDGPMMWRKNRRDLGGGEYGVDLNRNYSYEWGGDGSSGDPSSTIYRGPSAFSEPETQALRDFILAHDFVTHDSYHSVAALVLWPWGYTSATCPDHALFTAFGTERARDTGYVPQAAAALYPASGVTLDWSYGDQGIYAFTTEVGGSSFWPNDSEIPGLVAENLYSNIYLALMAGSFVRIDLAQVTGGDGNGHLDPGETANLLVTLENPGLADSAANVTATLRSDDAYIQLVDAEASFGLIPSQGSGDNAADLFSLTLDPAAPAGHSVELTVAIEWDDGYRSEESIVLSAGTPIVADDFESGNNGWTIDATNNCLTGDWEILDPNATAYQPGDDTSPAPGVSCWVTAQNTSDGADDVDGGISAIRSPTWDLSSYDEVGLSINYFHGQRDDGDDPSGDYFRVSLSNDGGATFPINLLSLGDAAHAPQWTALSRNLGEYLPLTDQMVLRFQASDGTPAGDIIEGGFDDLILTDGGSGNLAPGVPSRVWPAEGAVATSTPVLTVQNASDPESDPLTYGFTVYSDSLLTQAVRSITGVSEGTGETGWTVSPGLADGTYYWRAFAEDAEVRGPFMAKASFLVDSATDIASSESIPSFHLFPARPNPAVSGTTVRFVLPGEGRVRADVFDVMGRRVRSLYRGFLPAGAQALAWDGRDERGNESAAGVYFIRIHTGREEKAIKVTLVR